MKVKMPHVESANYKNNKQQDAQSKCETQSPSILINSTEKPGAEICLSLSTTEVPFQDLVDDLFTVGSASIRLVYDSTSELPSGIVARMGLPPAQQVAALDQFCNMCGKTQVKELVSFEGTTVGYCSYCGSGMVTNLKGENFDSSYADNYSSNYEQERLSNKPKHCWELLCRHTENLKGVKSILDIGCGEGDFLDLAKQANLYTAGIEISAKAALVAAQKGHEILCNSIIKVPFPPGSQFDIIVMWDVLEHLPQPKQALNHAFASLSPGGRLFVATPMTGSVYDRFGILLHRLSGRRFNQLLKMCWDKNHLFRFDRKGACRAIKDIGFSDVKAEPLLLLSLKSDAYAGGNILPTWTGHRFLDRYISLAGARVAKVFHLHNKILIEAVR